MDVNPAYLSDCSVVPEVKHKIWGKMRKILTIHIHQLEEHANTYSENSYHELYMCCDVAKLIARNLDHIGTLTVD